jgi:hypothetical protein
LAGGASAVVVTAAVFLASFAAFLMARRLGLCGFGCVVLVVSNVARKGEKRRKKQM